MGDGPRENGPLVVLAFTPVSTPEMRMVTLWITRCSKCRCRASDLTPGIVMLGHIAPVLHTAKIREMFLRFFSHS